MNQQARARIIRKMEKIIQESDQLVRDIDHWNKINPTKTPFDSGGDKVSGSLARKILALAHANEPIPRELSAKLINQLKLNAERKV